MVKILDFLIESLTKWTTIENKDLAQLEFAISEFIVVIVMERRDYETK